MSELDEYIEERKSRDKDFARGYGTGYEDFKVGLLIKQMRLENHSNDVRLSTLQKVANVFGKRVSLALL